MTFLLIVVVAAAVVAVAADNRIERALRETRDSCKYSKLDLFYCTDRYGDADHNKQLDRAELDAAFASLSKLERVAWWAKGGVDGVLDDCGDHATQRDGARHPLYCTPESFFNNAECMPAKDCYLRIAAIDHYCRRASEAHVPREDFVTLLNAGYFEMFGDADGADRRRDAAMSLRRLSEW